MCLAQGSLGGDMNPKPIHYMLDLIDYFWDFRGIYFDDAVVIVRNQLHLSPVFTTILGEYWDNIGNCVCSPLRKGCLKRNMWQSSMYSRIRITCITHALKTNMKPKNRGFRDDFPFERYDFHVV